MKSIKYVAEISDVREVSLFGAADLAYWQSHLKTQHLKPLEVDGAARLLIISAEMKFMGLRFSECSLSVFVRDTAGEGEAVYLVRAFNSRRFFAWVERNRFHAPYLSDSVEVDAQPAARSRVGPEDAPRLIARRNSNGTPVREGHESWHGWIYLPAPETVPEHRRYRFHGRVEGKAAAYGFDSESDEFKIEARGDEEGLAQLNASGFQPTEWIVRPAGAHAKSKTVRRG